MSAAPEPRPARAALYCRISRDDKGDELGVRRQEKEAREWAERHGWTIAEVYNDDDISAYSGKARPSYQRMMADIEAGTRDALIAWHPDRLHRSPRELEDFIDKVDAAAIPIGTVAGGRYDLTTSAGRGHARIMGVVARMESEHKAERIRSKHRELAEKGLPVGLGASHPFGYQPGGMNINDEEADLLRQAAADVLDGTPISSIARRWNKANVRTPFPRKDSKTQGWRPESVKALLLSPRPAGLRRHREDGTIVLRPAAWPAIIDPETHRRLQTALTGRNANTRPGPKTLLSGLVRCGAMTETGPCGATMMRDHKHGSPVFRCPTGGDIGKGGCGGNSLGAQIIEDATMRRVHAHIKERAATGADRILAEGADSEAAQVADELHQAEQFKVRLAEQLAAGGDFDAAEIAAMRRVNKARIAELRARLDQLTERATMARWDSLEAFSAEFEAADTDSRRALLSRLLEAITVLPYEGKRKDPGRVQVTFQ
jgi:DNA invertase Pin-like site-specific DNA recombinase